MDELLSEWGSRVRDLRRERRLTQAALAERAGVNPGYLSNIELGRTDPSSEVRMALARALAVRVEQIWSYPDTSVPAGPAAVAS